MALVPIAPGNSPVFTLIPVPAGIPTSIDNIGWAVETSDGSSVTMVSDQKDSTGMTAVLTIPKDATVGAIITFWCVYRNNDFSEVTGGPWSYTLS
jgi:hypothetical protein